MTDQLLENGTLICSIILNTPLGLDTSSLLVNLVYNGKPLIRGREYEVVLKRQSDKEFRSNFKIFKVEEGDYVCSASIIRSSTEVSENATSIPGI